MFERFTDRARTVLVEAQAEAVETGVAYIGTEHLLIGLLREGTGVAGVVLSRQGIGLEQLREKISARLAEITLVNPMDQKAALASIGIDLDTVRAAVEAAFGEGALPDPNRNPPFTPKAKACLELSLGVALRWRHRYIGTEHLLVGILDHGEGLAVAALRDLGADLEALRAKAKELAAPELQRADRAWDEFIALMRRVHELPDGARKEEIRSQLQGFQIMSEELAALRAAEEAFADKLEPANAAVAELMAAS